MGRTSLFVGDLAIFCTEVEIERLFSQYGQILEIKIMRSEETYRNLSYGFIKFALFECARQAMLELDGVLLCGRPMRYFSFTLLHFSIVNFPYYIIGFAGQLLKIN